MPMAWPNKKFAGAISSRKGTPSGILSAFLDHVHAHDQPDKTETGPELTPTVRIDSIFC